MNTEKIPEGRAAHSIAKTSQSKFYIFGGLGPVGCLNDLWEFDAESRSWKQVVVKGVQPGIRFGAAMTSVSNGDRTFLLVHGGMNSEGVLFSDLWAMRV